MTARFILSMPIVREKLCGNEYTIGIVPTIVVIKNGKVIFRQDGRSMAGLGKGDLERAVSEASAAR